MFCKRLISFLSIISCDLSTGYTCKHIGLEPSFSYKSTGFVSQVPILPSVKLSYLVNKINHYSCLVTVKSWKCSFIVLFKSAIYVIRCLKKIVEDLRPVCFSEFYSKSARLMRLIPKASYSSLYSSIYLATTWVRFFLNPLRVSVTEFFTMLFSSLTFTSVLLLIFTRLL